MIHGRRGQTHKKNWIFFVKEQNNTIENHISLYDSEIIFNADVRSSAYTKDGDDDEIIDYYESYFKEKIAYSINMPG